MSVVLACAIVLSKWIVDISIIVHYAYIRQMTTDNVYARDGLFIVYMSQVNAQALGAF